MSAFWAGWLMGLPAGAAWALFLRMVIHDTLEARRDRRSVAEKIVTEESGDV